MNQGGSIRQPSQSKDRVPRGDRTAQKHTPPTHQRTLESVTKFGPRDLRLTEGLPRTSRVRRPGSHRSRTKGIWPGPPGPPGEFTKMDSQREYPKQRPTEPRLPTNDGPTVSVRSLRANTPGCSSPFQAAACPHSPTLQSKTLRQAKTKS